MNILINCSNIKIGGGIQVSNSFLNEISKNTEHHFIIVLSKTLSNQINQVKFLPNHTFLVYDIKPTPLNIFFSSNKFLDRLLEQYHIDRVFSVFGPTYWKPKVKHVCGYAKPHYIYKNSPYFDIISFKEKFLLSIKEFFHLIDFKKNNDILITENEDVSDKVKKLLNKEVFTVTNYYNQVFDNKNEWELMHLPKFEGKYLLTISANYPHKNLSIIPHVINELIKRDIKKFKFIVTLEKGDLKNSNSIIDDYIIYLGKININQCPHLYEQSSYMFLPTLLECFSASYAEAMKMGKVILTSNLDFAKGICGDAAIYFNAISANDIVNKLIEIDEDYERQKSLIQNGVERLKKFDNYQFRANKYLEILLNETNHPIL